MKLKWVILENIKEIILPQGDLSIKMNEITV